MYALRGNGNANILSGNVACKAASSIKIMVRLKNTLY
jgi:hypothetical protein